MKITCLALFAVMAAVNAIPEKTVHSEENKLQIVCSAELGDLANELSEKYLQDKGIGPIPVLSLPAKEMEEYLGRGNILLARKAGFKGIESGAAFSVVLGREVIVPLINNNHPQKEDILLTGITREQFSAIYTSAEPLSWGSVLGVQNRNKVKALIPGWASSNGYLEVFVGATPAQMHGTVVENPVEMIRMIEASPDAIGFCSLACLADMQKMEVTPAVCLVPVDKDGDGNLEHFENIYGSCAQLSHGIFVGKYPRELYSKVYALTGPHPLDDEEAAFLEWLISAGQESLASAGILEIDYSEKSSAYRALHPPGESVAEVPVKGSASRTIFIILGVVFILGIASWMISMRQGKRQARISFRSTSKRGHFGPDTLKAPQGLFYDRSHTWAFMEKSGSVRIGIDDFIQHVTGPVTRVLIKNPGERLSRGETLITLVQQGKKLEIKSPVSGVVLEYNEALLEEAGLLNSDPYAGGWIYMVEPLNWMSEIKTFFTGEPYGCWLKTEFTRLKDFFVTGLNLKGMPDSNPVMQEGGEIMDGVLEAYGPEVWEEFQARFINCR